MYYEFYLDIYFLENLMMNYLILRMTGWIAKCKCSAKRSWTASFLGAAGACAIAVLPVHKLVFLSVIISCCLGVVMVAVCYGLKERNTVIRTVSAFYLLAFFLGGIWQILMRYVKKGFVLPVLMGYGVAWGILKLWKSEKGRAEFLYDVTITIDGKAAHLKGLLDSGNQLVQPVTGKPVQVVDFEAICPLLDQEGKEELEALMKLDTTGGATGRFTYIPYHSIGKDQGILPVLILDTVRIKHGESAWSTKGIPVAVSRTAVSSRGEYQMILHPRILE